MNVSVTSVQSGKDFRTFLRLPWRIYAGDSAWVPPLLGEQRSRLDRAKGSFFHHSSAEYFLARNATGEPVGRIAAIRFERHLEIYRDATGFFGFFECVDDPDTARALVSAAGDWLRAQGLERMRGPASFTINDECGLLIEGHGLDPAIMMPYNPPYYRRLLEGCGFEKAQDLFAYDLTYEQMDRRLLAQLDRISRRRSGFVIRPAEMARFDQEVGIFETLFAEAWAENWGAVPMRTDELKKMAADLKPFLIREFILIAESEGRPVGLLLAIPNINRAIKLADGRLFPLGLPRILLESRRIRHLRVVLLGVLKAYRKRGIEAALVNRLIENAVPRGYCSGELSWVLESNAEMNLMLQRAGGKRSKVYRFYDLPLGAPAS